MRIKVVRLRMRGFLTLGFLFLATSLAWSVNSFADTRFTLQSRNGYRYQVVENPAIEIENPQILDTAGISSVGDCHPSERSYSYWPRIIAEGVLQENRFRIKKIFVEFPTVSNVFRLIPAEVSEVKMEALSEDGARPYELISRSFMSSRVTLSRTTGLTVVSQFFGVQGSYTRTIEMAQELSNDFFRLITGNGGASDFSLTSETGRCDGQQTYTGRGYSSSHIRYTFLLSNGNRRTYKEDCFSYSTQKALAAAFSNLTAIALGRR